MSAVVCKIPADWWQFPSVCLYDWQTLMTGIAALGMGAITVALLRKQISQTDGLAREERTARLTVARAKLIVPSSRLAEHARECFDELLTIAPAIVERERRVIPAPLAIPPLPADIEIALDALLANTRDQSSAFAVSAIYGEQQVLAARASDMHENPRAHALSYDYYCMQPVIMHAFAINLLTYARRESDLVEPLSWVEMKASIRALAPHGDIRDRLVAFAEDKEERGISIPFAIREDAT